MPKHYVTFGQKHTHSINGKTLDKDTVAVFEVEYASEGTEKAFDTFNGEFCSDYFDEEWNEKDLEYFPKGYVQLDVKINN
tara:strand:+ start:22781 stop:23020 length:240 start_codon:yes stop_codon:yes gene_type:complete